MTEPLEFPSADRFAVGAFGEPGKRLFLLQVADAERVLTVKVEKAQVAELAQHLVQAMADRAVEPNDTLGARMKEEADPAWTVGAIRLGYDSAAGRVALVLEELQLEDDADAASAMIMISAEQAAAVISEIGDLVAAGRPPCPDCGYPLDPSGHVCPKSNGHRPPRL